MTINPIVIGVIIDQLSYVGGLTLYNMLMLGKHYF